jgi:hypothetical protein
MIKVYLHRRTDNNEIYYIGHGANARPWSFLRGRSKDWQSMYNQFGCKVEIIARYDNKELACAHEILLIAACREMSIPIVNHKSGGMDKNEGLAHSDASKQKISQARLTSNGNACKIRTPLGTFNSMNQAAKAHNMSIDQIYYRVRHKPYFELA